MGFDFLNRGKIAVEVSILNPERLLNILWAKNVNVLNVKRVDIATVIIEIEYDDYDILKDSVHRLRGKMKVIGSGGFLFFVGRLKRKASLVIGGVLFIIILFYLSTFVWKVEINTKKNVSPYELRQQLYNIGIKPGIKKKDINAKEIEKKIEDVNSEVLWLRARVEGSTLKIYIEEKVNPPKAQEKELGNLVAKMDGEIKRIYAFSGRAAVPVRTMIKAGEVVIEGINGKEEEPYEEAPEGVVMANTFYEKEMKVQIDGTRLERNGERDSDIYLNILGKKIYLKKAIKDFEHYDKIEQSGKVFNKVIYFERKETPVKLTKEEAVDNSVKELGESLLKDLTREAVIVDKIVNTEEDGQGNIIVKVIFVVEQNIVDNTPVEY